MDKKYISIILLNYQTWEETIKEAKQIHDIFLLDLHQFIILDNNSPNDSDKKLREYSCWGYKYIQTGNNKGYAYGNNIGLRYAYEKGFLYAWILNNDIVIEDDNILNEMLRIFSKDDKVAVINPDIYTPDGYLYNRYSSKRSFWDYTLGYLSYKKKGRKLDVIDGYGYIWRPQGCCMMVDLKKINYIDYLDENTFLYCEEAILAEKLSSVGYRIACACNLRVIHDHSKTVQSVMKKMDIIRSHNKSFKYYLTYYRKYNRLQVITCLFFATINMFLTN